MSSLNILLSGVRSELATWVYIQDSNPTHENRNKRLRRIAELMNRESSLKIAIQNFESQ